MATIIRQSKWITDVHSHTALTDAAGAIVGARLQPIAELLVNASMKADEDPEHVHQLRVATRRADAAMRAFRSCFKKKRWTKVDTALKRIRRGAAAARSCDVHIMALAAKRKATDAEYAEALKHSIKHTRQQRETAQSSIDEAANRYPPDKLRRLFEKLAPVSGKDREPGAGTESKDATPTLLHCALDQLTLALDKVRAATAADLSSYDHLHELRLKGKRLRYAMEIFAYCFDEKFRNDLYPHLKAMQDRLGEINDSYELAIRIESCAADAPNATKAPLTQLAKDYRAERRTRRREFLTYWSETSGAAAIDGIGRFIEDPALHRVT